MRPYDGAEEKCMYNCHDFEKMAEQLDSFRLDFLFDFDTDGIGPMAEQHYLMALDHLSLAIGQMKVAAIQQMREEAGK